MAVRFDSSSDFLSSTTNLLDYNSTYTVMAWIYIDTDRNAFSTIFCLFGDDNNYDDITLDSDGTTFCSFIAQGGTFQKQTGTNLSTGTWYHVTAVRSSATACNIYLNGVSDAATNTKNVGARSAINGYRLGYLSSSFPLPFDGRMFGFKMWDTNLSVAEIQQEMNSIVPQTNFANLNRWSPIFAGSGERARDYGPNRDNWTENGTLTDEDPPPVSWGAGPIIVPFVAGGAAATSLVFNPNPMRVHLTQ